ncbi:feruloyl esterase B-2-like protein 1 [Colletotrichum truncatum]|uniref:Feruloyl esterase B-2-like protein 1 n=1 Tax=Colletotrichum truncatum TaxID=5467 RepID=A0ACC3Z3E7_COLTU|nr:feruloyl esterase B-2-like protein 1 [Colletotrichum truncatum]KAF6795473.1 feruloyl esterase B-2-like protein 1 [Colletotrichum truncatum]
MLYLVVLGALVQAASSSASNSSAEFRQQCLSFGNSTVIPGAESYKTEFLSAGSTLRLPGADPSCGRTSQTVSADLCRLTAQVATSTRSGFKFEAWLPQNWTGRFLSTGNGGLGGCIQYEDLDYGSSLGFATVATNNGHDGMSGVSFLNNPDVIEDFAYRALHTGVVVGKDVSKSFYGSPHTKSYYLGCSTGGRQGFKEAQAFPDDFDGIVAGAPAFSFNNLTSWSCHFLPLTGLEGADTFIPMTMWPTIHEDILKQCDKLDGVADGIIESPELCDYKPDGLVCESGNATQCLTEKQVETLRAIYSPLLDASGSLVYPRMQPGAELTGAPQTYFTGQAFGAADWFRYAIFNDSNWDPLSLKPADYVLSSSLNLFNIETFDGDLSAFQSRGGKLLHYHGLVDGTISSDNSPRYYEHVSKIMGLQPAALDEFYRFFRISGMAHCGGGPGATFIGNQAQSVASLNPDENVLMAIVRWVEEDVAPETVVGTAYINGTKAAGVDFKRKHCRWPRRNVFQGGDFKDAESWTCVN